MLIHKSLKSLLLIFVGTGWFYGAVLAQSGISLQEENVPNQESLNGVSFRDIKTNGILMRIAEAGSHDPLILLAHRWPESWCSWRHQFAPLVAAGYRVVAPMMRGYSDTDAPEPVETYDIEHLANDMVGVLDALGEETAIMAGHDWGAIVAWN